MTLSTHVLDTATGLPAVGVPVAAERLVGSSWTAVAAAVTDQDGRVAQVVPPDAWTAGRWRLVLDTASHLGAEAFFPEVTVVFTVADPAGHLHVPVLLSPYGYTTYRGS